MRKKKFILHEIVTYRYIVVLALLGFPIGALVGLLEVIFGKGLDLVTSLRLSNPILYIPFLPLAGLIIAFVYKKWGGKCNKGMGIIFLAAEKEERRIPWRNIPLLMVSSWLTHLCGGSAGREGVAVQLGATLSYGLGKKLPTLGGNTIRQILIVSGIAAGFAGLFQTPFAAIFFALELLAAGRLKYRALLPIITADMTSYFVARYFGLKKLWAPIKSGLEFFEPTLILKLAILGIIFGIAGAVFAWSLVHTKVFLAKKIKDPLARALSVGIFIAGATLLLWQGRYSGFGTNLTMAALTGGEVFAWDWALKLILTVLTLSAGFQGGELTPIFAIGSSLGCIIAGAFGLPPQFVAAMGFSAMFGAATNTVLAPVFIGIECFGIDNIYFFIIVCTVAFIFNFGQTIYPLQKRLR